ncbi:MAG: type II secretion system F family protein [Paucibacter sp.]|nr:type II secretion system F family protein [Roseateles sp.]
MARFNYRGRNAAGQLVSGVLEAPSTAGVVDELRGQGIVPVDIGEASAAGAGLALDLGALLPSLGSKVRHVDILLFSRQLHALLKAGVPIMRALGGLGESAGNPAMKQVIADVATGLESGRDLSSSLSQHPEVFNTFYLSMVRVGEATGQLEEIFLRLFEHMEFERQMREQVKAALRYPAFVIVAMAIALLIVNLFVIPAFAKVFKGFGADLPLMTQILLGFSQFMVTWWPALLGGAVLGFFVFRVWVSQPAGRMQWEAATLRFPLAGKIIHKASLARFSRSFSLGLHSGVPVTQALGNAVRTIDNSYIATKIDTMREHIERGESVLRAAISAKFFTPIVLQMVAVGEESGALDDMMEEVGQMYQREVEYELKTLGQQIEPILIVCLGALVLVLALGIFLPMWDLGRVALKH